MKPTTCGIDEAGRGPVIGPLVLGAAVFDESGAQKLREIKVRDSKRLTPSRRGHLEPLIKDLALEWAIACIEPGEIDLLRKTLSLNAIEARKSAEMILALRSRPGKVIIDAADSVEANYDRRIREELTRADPSYRVPRLICEHKADDNYVEVSAASILAKVARDRAIEALRPEYGDFGSGYPSDPATQAFMAKIARGADCPDCVRKSWSTFQRGKQTSLGDW